VTPGGEQTTTWVMLSSQPSAWSNLNTSETLQDANGATYYVHHLHYLA
jgi:hypothetical protein